MKLAPLLLSAGFVLAASIAQAQSRYSYSTDGSEAIDSQTGLVWRRCAEGMTWSAGSCTGSPNLFMREQALAHAKTQAGWRLPNVKELASILDLDRNMPTIDMDAFPATLSRPFWSSSPYPGLNGSAWVVGFDGGYIQYQGGGMPYPVRLVR